MSTLNRGEVWFVDLGLAAKVRLRLVLSDSDQLTKIEDAVCLWLGIKR